MPLNSNKRRTLFSVGVIAFISVLLFFITYTPGTFLAGWDNIMPELNFRVSFIHNFFGVWQEYRGVGFLDGMSHVANLPHTVLLWFLSFVLPANLLRYAFIFLMHALGGIGAYILLDSLLPHDQKNRHLIVTTGALFYLLNLATIQMFFTPLESFSIHFASLPWLAWGIRQYYTTNTKMSRLFLLFILLCSIPQYFVPTFLIPNTILAIGLTISAFQAHIPDVVRKTFMLLFIAIAINAFWLLPYLYGVPQNAPIIMNAKINQMSSDEAFAQNQAYGGLKDVLLLHGFSLDYQDTAPNNTSVFVMEPWRNYVNLPIIQIFAGTILALTLFGCLLSLKKTNERTLGFFIVFVVCFIFLANDTPIVRSLTQWAQMHIPFFREALRFPFTKFSLLFVLSYTVFFTFGLASLIQSRKNITLQHSVIVASIVIILCGSLPAFTGNFIYPYLKITIPQDYFSLFAYMNALDPTARIALLPQPDYWSWKYYDFGYRGSGFLWDGLLQPTMDRAFDPWNNDNENYYWELSRALYAKNPQALAQVFSKYNITYILLDTHLTTSGNTRTLFVDDIRQLLSTMPTVTNVNSFGKLTLYSYSSGTTNQFVTIQDNLPIIAPTYSWTDNDVAYSQNGNYSTVKQNGPEKPSIIYPFRSLFTKRSVLEREFSIKETPTTIIFNSIQYATSAGIVKSQAIVYDSSQSAALSAKSVAPCAILPEGTVQIALKRDEQAPYLQLHSLNQRACLTLTAPSLEHKNGYLVASESRHETGQPLRIGLINKTAKHTELETYVSTGTQWNTDYFVLPPLASDGLGYDIYLSSDAIGRYETINDIRSVKIYKIPYTQMVEMKMGNGSHPPAPLDSAKRAGEAGFMVDSKTNGIASSAALLGPRNDIEVSHPNPSYYKVSMPQSVNASTNQTLILSQSFDNGWKAWEVETCDKGQETGKTNFLSPVTCHLSPYLPFLFGTEIKEHVLVNNWENVWELPAEKLSNTSKTSYLGKQNDALLSNQVTNNQLTIVLFFWPQLLEWVGFILLPIPFIYAFARHGGFTWFALHKKRQ